jgi:uncharacterized protein YkwD
MSVAGDPLSSRAGLHLAWRCIGSAAVSILMLSAASSWAGESSRLVSLVNEYRQSPQECRGKPAEPVGPLAPDPALSQVQLARGTQLQQALKDVGYQAAQARAIAVSGPTTPEGAMDLIRKRYCSMLLNQRFTAIGASRKGNTWHIVLAQPLLSDDLGSWQEAGKELLKLVNAARAEPRTCGSKKFSAAPPVEWNAKLADAALAHSRDMAKRNYFSHQAKDGSTVGARAKKAGYRWRRIGENIATGQGSPEQVMSGWLASPGHCANIMNPHYTEMGVAYAVNPKSDTTIYWTQVFGTPR